MAGNTMVDFVLNEEDEKMDEYGVIDLQ